MLFRCRTRTLDLTRPCVMGILNVTPDSFSDGGLHHDAGRAVEAGLRMVEQGAAMLDVGGESTRPGARPVSAAEEVDRVAPVIEALARRTEVVLSVDTSKPQVIEAAMQAGAHLVNDVRALRLPGALAAAAAADAAVCVMHMVGEPGTMQSDPRYDDVVDEVRRFLVERVAACREAGIGGDSIAVDPGIGFGKTLQHNLELLRHLRDFTQLGGPLLVGVSRKSMVGMITGRPVAERRVGSATLAAACVERGARIVRVHDVAETVDAVKIVEALGEHWQPA
jgi:dihydropteroate synthase